MKKKIDIYQILVILSISLILFIFYGENIISPNKYMFSTSGDGMKNYFTYASYIKNNQSLFNFEGMNYPYGEHFLYTDCTPLLSMIIRSISFIFPSITNYSVGIINELIFLSYVVCALYLFKIFDYLKIKPLISILFSIGITLLCPQIIRTLGHLALSVSCFLPMTIYFILIADKQTNKLKYSIYIFSLLTALLFTHAYLGIISFTLFFLHFSIKEVIQLIKIKKFKPNYLHVLASITIPLLLFNLFVIATDSHTGRTNNPYGIFSYYASIKSFLLPTIKGFTPYIDSIFHYESTIWSYWESWAYIGVTAIFAIHIYFIFFMKSIVQRNKINYRDHEKELLVLLIASFLIALYSMCLLYKTSFVVLLDIFPVLKQFRGLGRFAWVFYFSVNIFSVFVIDKISKSIPNKPTRLVFILSLALILIFEGSGYHRFISSYTTNSYNLFSSKSEDKDITQLKKKIKLKNFQSMVVFPYYYIGSENNERIPTNISSLLSRSMSISYHLNVPLMNSFLTRTSIWEGKNLMQLTSEPFYFKKIKRFMKNKKNILIVTDNTELSSQENYYINQSKLLFKGENFSYYSISFNRLFENSSKKEILKFKQLKKSLKHQNSWYYSGSNKFIFECYSRKYSHRDTIHCFTGTMDQYEIVKEIPSTKLDTNTQYTARIWIYNGGENFGQDKFSVGMFVQTTDTKSSKWISGINSAKKSCMIDGEWSMIEVNFKTESFPVNYQFVLYGDVLNKIKYKADDLLIYPSESNIYKEINGKTYLYNDRIIKD